MNEPALNDPAAVKAQYATSANLKATTVTPGLRRQLRARIQQRIDADGCFRIGKDGGLFAARAPAAAGAGR